MPVSKTEVSQHKDFLKRQAIYETRYYRQYYRLLSAQYSSAISYIRNNGTDAYLLNDHNIITNDSYFEIYNPLYSSIGSREANITWNRLVAPELKQGKAILETKDLIDTIAEFIIDESMTEAERLSQWRELMLQYTNSYIWLRIGEVANTTRNRVRNIIQTTNELNDIIDKLRDSREFNLNRARAIARTETMTAMNKGAMLSVYSSPFEYEKIWVPILDDRTRDGHFAMAGGNYIPIDEPFQVPNADGIPEAMQHPGDGTVASASNIVNCRCSVVFRLLRDSRGNPLRK